MKVLARHTLTSPQHNSLTTLHSDGCGESLAPSISSFSQEWPHSLQVKCSSRGRRRKRSDPETRERRTRRRRRRCHPSGSSASGTRPLTLASASTSDLSARGSVDPPTKCSSAYVHRVVRSHQTRKKANVHVA
ncbi:hypothetical protein F2P81_002954 [Scophthalmus maximus]|uniref:Uncharacterized protein n=1 Tax=Scophthalmus maximus TaxID=52904 RepID=A0A6A4T8B9_SCOMX|nr:hypothetical protein F2P81_002954 [Scophthalmus maximus]